MRNKTMERKMTRCRRKIRKIMSCKTMRRKRAIHQIMSSQIMRRKRKPGKRKSKSTLFLTDMAPC